MINSLAFSPDGHTLSTTTGVDSTVRLWDVADLAHPALLDASLAGPYQWNRRGCVQPRWGHPGQRQR
ncbi:MAG: WD40 repeat domain-containing protein [Pseudonocardia sp.]|nr:WD40 repeat domain-containing protein [Pseudonocardia sp.]